MNCNKCGKPVTPVDKFCPHCGSPQNQKPTNSKKCLKCSHENLQTASFCEKCGTPLSETQTASHSASNQTNTITSQGNYSGTMIKSKSKFWKRLLWGIVIAVVIVGVALIIWFQLDPDAEEKLKTYAGGLLVVVIFLFMVLKGKRRRRPRGGGYSDVNDDDDDGDWGDDGGDDD